jgi:Tfp pilus assembly protein PilE
LSFAGFILTEMKITIAVVVILAVVALPSYKDYVKWWKIPGEANALATLGAQMEQFCQDNRTYAWPRQQNNGAAADRDRFHLLPGGEPDRKHGLPEWLRLHR